MEYLFTSESIISFLVLVLLEIVLGIDNVIFVSIIMNRLSTEKEQKKARTFWMISGMIVRSLLLPCIGMAPFAKRQACILRVRERI